MNNAAVRGLESPTRLHQIFILT